MELLCRYGGKLVADGEMDIEAMLTVFYAVLLSTMGVSDAQMAFPHVAKGQRAVARVFRGLSAIPTPVASGMCFICQFQTNVRVWTSPIGCGTIF